MADALRADDGDLPVVGGSVMSWTDIVKVRLSKPWGPHKAGTVVEVDAIRAGWLDENGFVDRPDAKPTRKRKGID